MNVKLKRAYESVSPSDGIRILVERLWPRGLSKESAHIDHWVKDVSPSTALRQWYGHDIEKWPEFKRKYIAELKENQEAVEALYNLCKGHSVTFVYGARDELHNSALVLKDFLEHSEKK